MLQLTHMKKTDCLFLGFEEQLKQLLMYCLKYGSLIVKELQNERSHVTIQVTCTNGCSCTWQSKPTLSGTKEAGNLLLAALIFFSDVHFAKFQRFCNNMNLKTICEDTYTTLRQRFVFPVIDKTWAKELNAMLTNMKSQEAEVVQCDSPGHLAKYCMFTFLDV